MKSDESDLTKSAVKGMIVASREVGRRYLRAR